MTTDRSTGSPAQRRVDRASAASRRSGYVVAGLINALLLYLVNVRPGWQVVPFLTPETTDVLDVVNTALVVAIGANVVYLVTDPPWLHALGDLLLAAVGMVALVATWRVFPFDFAGQTFDWALAARVLLVLAMVGTAIAAVVALVRLVAWATAGTARRP
ncbi:hypothetical protein [Puerhibacterium sp. TATVAM-FAB25]|uniref:hypothetical protein n=1 Tax=Puerhibacterium sp. TATVAM-FAB25 TaxID=3093699 RepID=UPI00397B0820